MENENLNIENDFYNLLKSALKKSAKFSFPTKFDKETYDKLFTENDIESPIETIRMGEKQYEKFCNNWDNDVNRKYQMGMAYQTMTNPDFIYEREVVANGKLNKKNIYAKAYIQSDYCFVLSIVALTDDNDNVCISCHMADLNNGLNQVKKNGRLLYINKKIFDTLNFEKIEDETFKNFVKRKECLTEYKNIKYPSPKVLSNSQLFDLRFRDELNLEDFIKNKLCFNDFENLILNKFNTSFNDKEQNFLLEINSNMEAYCFENLYDAIELMHNSNEFAKDLKEIRNDLEKVFLDQVKNLSDWQIYDLYEGLVYEIALKQIKEYKDRVIQNPKFVDRRLETINRIYRVVSSKEL